MSFEQFYCGLLFLSGSSLHIPPRNFGWVANYLTCTELNHLALLITRVQTYLHVSTRSNLLKPSKQHFKGLAFSGIHSYSYPPVWGCTIFARFTLPLWRRVRVRDYLHLSLVPRHQVFHARPVALSTNRVWTRSLVKLGHNHTSVLACCCTNQIAQVNCVMCHNN